jgi:hypothetical protein
MLFSCSEEPETQAEGETSPSFSILDEIHLQRSNPSDAGTDGAQIGLIYRPVDDRTAETKEDTATAQEAPSYSLKAAPTAGGAQSSSAPQNSKPYIPKPIRVPGYSAVQYKQQNAGKNGEQIKKETSKDDYEPDEHILNSPYGPTKSQIEISQAFQVMNQYCTTINRFFFF